VYSSPNRSPRGVVRFSKGDSVAGHAAHALRRLNGISKRFSGTTFSNTDIVADIQVMCEYNDLRNITLRAYVRDTIVAEWIVHVYDNHYTLQEPMPMPSGFILGSASFKVVVSRTGQEKLYAHLLKGSWIDSHTEAHHQYTGTVLTLPRRGRPGIIISGKHRMVLLSRYARNLKVGERVRFSTSWDTAKKQKVAHSILRVA
jgi:hypothetical protein